MSAGNGDGEELGLFGCAFVVVAGVRITVEFPPLR